MDSRANLMVFVLTLNSQLSSLNRHDESQALFRPDEVVGVLRVVAQIDLDPVNVAREYTFLGGL